jgi:hypothetical protein
VNQVTISNGKLIPVKRTLDDSAFDRCEVQGMLSMRAMRLNQEDLTLALNEQQTVAVNLELAAIGIVEVNQFFQCIKTHSPAPVTEL